MTAGASQRINGGEGDNVLTADAIAVAVGGRVVGDGTATVSSIAPLDRARPEQLSFLATAKYAAMLERSQAGVVLVSPALAESAGSAKALILVDNPHDALLSLIPQFYRSPERTPGIHPSTVIGRGSRVGKEVFVGSFVSIGAGAVIGDRVSLHSHVALGAGVEIGDDSMLYSGVTVYSGTRIGRRVLVHGGVRLGSDGFGYVFRDGGHEKIPHVGRCIIGDDVEIGANTTIDRGSIDDTVIGAGTKIDNLVQLAHNVHIGKLCLIMSQVGIAGSSRLEDGCIVAGQVGMAGHHTIGAGATIAAQAGVFGDVPAGETWSGYPARPHKEALRAQAALFKLPGLIRRLEQMAKGGGWGGGGVEGEDV